MIDNKTYIENLEKLIKYQVAYDILMDYFDEFPDKEQHIIHNKLKKLGL